MKAHKSRRKAKPKFEAVKEGNVLVKVYHRVRRIGKARYHTFEVADYSEGRRRLRSFADHAKAVKEAERIARLIASGDVEAAGISGKERAAYGRAIGLLRETGVPIELAAAHFSEAHKILGGDSVVEAAKFFAKRRTDKLPAKTVAEVVAELIAHREGRKKSKRYLDDLRSRLGRFAEAFHVGIADLTTGDVQRWLDNLKAAPQTVKNFRRVVGTLFSFAEARGCIFKNSNPVEGTEAVQTNGGDVAIYTPSELARLLAAAPPDFLPCIALGAFAGLRTAEIQRLHWRDVDLPAGFVTVAKEKAKTASRRIVPITPNLAAWLTPYAKKTGPIWKGTRDDFHHGQVETAAGAGIAWKPNALRHSFCSYRLAAVQSAAQVALEAGNSPGVVFKHYRELVRPADAVKWFAIEPKCPSNVIPAPVAAQV